MQWHVPQFRKNKCFIPIFYKCWLEIMGKHQLFVYADDGYKLGGSVHTVKWNRTLVFASKEIELEVNADKIITRPCLETSMQDKIATWR
jgi:hypothetical protein